VLKRSRRSFPFVQTVFADGAYAGRLVAWARDKANVTLEIVRRMPWMKGCVVIRRRWVVERTDPWIMKCRVLRIAREDEQLPSVVETLITLAASAALLRRRASAFSNTFLCWISDDQKYYGCEQSRSEYPECCNIKMALN
jgi:transposase